MPDRKLPPSLEDLTARLKTARAKREGEQAAARQSGSGGGIGLGLRMGVEIVAALGIGVGIGWLLDAWFGTLPLFLIVFFLLGAAAGFMSVYRTAAGMGHGVGYRPAERQAGDDEPDEG